MGKSFTEEQLHYIVGPEFDLFGYYERFPEDSGRPPEGVARARRRYRTQESGVLYQREDNPVIEWDKKQSTFHWRDALPVAKAMQEMRRKMSTSQDRARIRVNATGVSVPILFLSDFHIGSWGTNLEEVARLIEIIKRYRINTAILGDMIQMSIKLRGVKEVSDNQFPPDQQIEIIESLLVDDLMPQILWGTWDNHSVKREEDAVGFSRYAEMLKKRTVYHSGIGHIDLEVGNDIEGFQTYKICSAHYFRGRSRYNPVYGQMTYMRFEGIDRELAVAGDSHKPAMHEYTDGEMDRIAINCGTLQKDSGYAKRYFSLDTHDWMPVVEFYPDRHLMVPYASLGKYLATKGLAA